MGEKDGGWHKGDEWLLESAKGLITWVPIDLKWGRWTYGLWGVRARQGKLAFLYSAGTCLSHSISGHCFCALGDLPVKHFIFACQNYSSLTDCYWQFPLFFSFTPSDTRSSPFILSHCGYVYCDTTKTCYTYLPSTVHSAVVKFETKGMQHHIQLSLCSFNLDL